MNELNPEQSAIMRRQELGSRSIFRDFIEEPCLTKNQVLQYTTYPVPLSGLFYTIIPAHTVTFVPSSMSITLPVTLLWL